MGQVANNLFFLISGMGLGSMFTLLSTGELDNITPERAPIVQTTTQPTTQPTTRPAYNSREAPKLDWVDNQFISFSDNLAPGMEAYLFRNGMERAIKLKSSGVHEGYIAFKLPENLLETNGWFDTRAIDRDGNVFFAPTLYVLDGVVIRNAPPGFEQ